MTEPLRIDLAPEQRRLVWQILRANLPAAVKVWCSARGRAGGRGAIPISIWRSTPGGRQLDEAARLADAFSESDLSYRVDVVDWRAIDDRFRQIIARERVPLAWVVGVTRWRVTPPAGRRGAGR